MNWGGGSKDHPGKKRDPRLFSAENNNYQLSQERWTNTEKVSRKGLLLLAQEKHNPQPADYLPLANEAIEMTKVNKEIVEKTSAVIKYQDGQAYVAGESEWTQVHKVNNVPEDTLKQAKKAEI